MSAQQSANLIDLLKQLEQAFPPAAGPHTLAHVRYGSDADGWKDGLKLTVTYPLPAPHNYMLDDKITIEASDLKKPTATLVSELVGHISKSRDFYTAQCTPSLPQPSAPTAAKAGPDPA